MLTKHGPGASLPTTWYVERLTQVAQKSQGIQTLLEAEKEASKIVEKARACTCLSLTQTARRS